MSNLLKAAFTVATITAISALSAPAQAKQFCCWNKAICKAVCGSACCGSNLAAKAEAQDKMSRPALKAAAPAKPQRQ